MAGKFLAEVFTEENGDLNVSLLSIRSKKYNRLELCLPSDCPFICYPKK